MTGTADQLYFFVLFRSTMHGQVRLQKMAGDLQDNSISSNPRVSRVFVRIAWVTSIVACSSWVLLVLLAPLLVVQNHPGCDHS